MTLNSFCRIIWELRSSEKCEEKIPHRDTSAHSIEDLFLHPTNSKCEMFVFTQHISHFFTHSKFILSKVSISQLHVFQHFLLFVCVSPWFILSAFFHFFFASFFFFYFVCVLCCQRTNKIYFVRFVCVLCTS